MVGTQVGTSVGMYCTCISSYRMKYTKHSTGMLVNTCKTKIYYVHISRAEQNLLHVLFRLLMYFEGIIIKYYLQMYNFAM